MNLLSVWYFCTQIQIKSGVCAFQITWKLLSFTLEGSWRIDRRSMFSVTKGSIYIPYYMCMHIKGSIYIPYYMCMHISIQAFTMWMDWPEIELLMEAFCYVWYAHTAFFQVVFFVVSDKAYLNCQKLVITFICFSLTSQMTTWTKYPFERLCVDFLFSNYSIPYTYNYSMHA